MKKLLELFKRKSKESKKIEVKTPDTYYSISGKTYCVSEVINTKVQASVENKKVYGWAIEIRWHNGDGNWCTWVTHPNNKIYCSVRAANEAALQIDDKKNLEWRVKALYALDEVEWRDFKIEKLLKPELIKEKSPIKAWKLKEDYIIDYKTQKFEYKKGTLFIKLETGHIIDLKNTKSPIGHTSEYHLKNELIPKGIAEEVKLQDEKWSHPHLLKELKIHLKSK